VRTSPIVGRNILGFACGQKALLRAGRPQRLQTYNVAIHGRSKPLKLRGRRRRARKLGFRKATHLTMCWSMPASMSRAGWRAKDQATCVRISSQVRKFDRVGIGP
jgi:hypothetical protein